MRKVDLEKTVFRAWRELPVALQKLPAFVSVSGGGDSTALAAVSLSLRRQLSELHWIHLNYGLRRPDSDREEAYLRLWAKREGVPLHVHRVRSKKKPKNLQAWARERRFRFFIQVLKRQGRAKGVLWLAHHEQDQAETVLLRLIRGSGLTGRSGRRALEAWKIFWLVRPLLDVPTEAIQVYLKAHGLRHFQDWTNGSGLYLRNRVRHRILPLLQSENPKILPTLCELGRRAGEAALTLKELAEKQLKNHLNKNKKAIDLSIEIFKKTPEGLWPYLLQAYFLRLGWEAESLNQVLPRLVLALKAPQRRQIFRLKAGKRLGVGPEGIRV